MAGDSSSFSQLHRAQPAFADLPPDQSAPLQQRYRLLFEKNLAGVVIFDAAGRILDCNCAWTHMLGYADANEVRTRNIEEFCRNSPCRKTVGNGPEHPCELHGHETELRRKDSSSVWVVCNCTLISPANDPPLLQATAIDISAHKQAEQALRAAEEHFRILVEQAPDGIFITDADGKYIDVNSAGAEMLGYTRGEVLQLSISDVVAPEEVPVVASEVEILHSGRPSCREWKFRRKDGSCFPGEVVARRLPDGRLQGILRDVSERKQAEEIIRRSEQRFRVALKHSPVTVFSQDRELRYTWVYNRQLYSQRDIIGKTDVELLGSATATCITELKQQVLRTGSPLREEIVIASGGKNYSFDVTLEPLFDSQGRIIGITGASMDIARLRELTDALQHTKDR